MTDTVVFLDANTLASPVTRTLAEVAKNPPRSEAEVHRMLGRRHPNLTERFAGAYETTPVPADDDQPGVLFRGVICVRCAARLDSDDSLRLRSER